MNERWWDLFRHWKQNNFRDSHQSLLQTETSPSWLFVVQASIKKTNIVSTVADSAVSVSWSLNRVTFFTTSELLAITAIHVQPSRHTGQRAPVDDTIIMGGTDEWHDVGMYDLQII